MMEHILLLDLATDLGYELAMCGAETFRVEETINRVLAAYGLEAEAFAIPNYLIVSIQSQDGTPVTRMRRIGHHGNDLDSVELYSSLSRAICAERPAPEEAVRWLDEVRRRRRNRGWLEADQGPGLEAALLEPVLLGLVHFDRLYPGNFGYLADAILQFGNRGDL